MKGVKKEGGECISVFDDGESKVRHLGKERKEICRGVGGAGQQGIGRGLPGMGTLQGSTETYYKLPGGAKREVSGLWVKQEGQHHQNG